MTPPDDDLRSAYASLPRQAGPCPAPEELAAVATGELTEPERTRLADHVVACARCAADWRILSETHRDLSPQRGARLRWFALAAAAVIALAGAGALILLRSERRDDAFRGTAVAPASVEPAEGATLASPPSALHWPAQRDAEGYRVKLFASSGDAVWDADAGNLDRIAVPEAVRSRLQPGRYFWTVEVRLPLERQRLGPYPFTIAR